MLNLSSELAELRPVRSSAPWAGHEHVRGWGVFNLPLASGHVLGLRVFPENDFGSYRSVWHRDPAGGWTILVDGPRLDTACPRYFGAACERTGHAGIDIRWTGPATAQVTVDELGLDWTFTASTTPLLSTLNTLSRAMPLSSWRPRPLLRARERMARALGMGELQMSGVMPSGHTGTLMPQRMYFIDEARAVLGGTDLGHPVQVKENPRIGDVALPARGVLGIGGGMWQILDPAEYHRTRTETDPHRAAGETR